MSTYTAEKGNISVNTDNIFPIIKKFLYSDHEIFLRELVSNATDATQKLKRLASLGEFTGELGELDIEVLIDSEKGTLTVRDRGLGMTGEEVKKYLNQVAFSGAEEFLKKYEAAGDGDIIGKFGLGFYSAFMVASKVEVVTQSWQEGAPAVRWVCEGSTEFTLEETEKEFRGTDIILHVNEADKEFLEAARIRSILEKYCRFLPFPVKFEDAQINDAEPLWKKNPADLKDEDYKQFFQQLFPFEQEPLFWIHLNVDYPFNLTGILYFPKIRPDVDPRKNRVQLYSRQVFITDEVSQIVPDYLMLLQGVIDSPDIPLNVSRSYLQSDANVKKISGYITKKVADKLHEIFFDNREQFEEKWDGISLFVKYGMLTDDKFYEKAEKFALLKNLEGRYFTLEEYKSFIQGAQTDKDGNVTFLYATHPTQQDVFVAAAQAKGYDTLLLDGALDSHFIGHLERKLEKTRWVRVDSDTPDKLIAKEPDPEPASELLLPEEEVEKVKALFDGLVASLEAPKGIVVQTQRLTAQDAPLLLTRPEFMRRMKEMSALGGGFGADFPETINLVVNTAHPVVQSLAHSGEAATATQLLDLALLAQNLLQGKRLTAFIQRSVGMLPS